MISRSRAESLFWDLVRSGPSSPKFAATVDIEDVRSQLEPLYGDQLVLAATAVNANRVDIEAESGTDRWRVVYLLDDDDAFVDVHVWRRPPVFDRKPSIAVVINGPSGSGKSSLMRAVVEADPRPWVRFDEPWLGDVRQEYLIWPETAPHLHDGYFSSIATLASAGNLVLVSAAGRSFDSISATFADVATLMVGLNCPLDVLIQREHGRGGRAGGLAEASLRDHDGWSYDLVFDTAELAPHAIAEAVLDSVNRFAAD